MAYMARIINGMVVAVHSRTPEYNATQVDSWQFVQTSYNVRGGVYYDPGTNQPHPDQVAVIAEQDGRQRKNYAGVGYIYDVERDAFIPPKPYRSWVLNEFSCLWEAPVPYPDDGNMYTWGEDAQEWVLVEMSDAPD